MRLMTELSNTKKISEFDDKSLLLVDDDNPFRERLARAMQKKGFEVIQVSIHDHIAEFKQEAGFLEHVFPSWQGLKITRRAFYSYAGILSYLVRGRIGISDVFHSEPSYLAPPSFWLGRG